MAPDGELDRELARELEALERSLLEPEVRGDRARVRALLAEEFREFGSSGRVWEREAIVEELARETAGAGEMAAAGVMAGDVAGEAAGVIASEDWNVVRLAAEAALVTYVAERSGRRTLRSSVWVRRDGRWQLLFHQGTPAGHGTHAA